MKSKQMRHILEESICSDCIHFYCILSDDVVSVSGAVVAWVYRVAGKDMAPLEALVFGVGQTTLTILISFSRILATL